MKLKVVTNICMLALLISAAHADEIDAAAIVATHNKWRTEVGVTAPLSYSTRLAKSAQVWANHLKRSNHCQMQHSNTKGHYGENLFWASARMWSDGRKELRKVTPAEVVDSWGSEKADYDPVRNECRVGAVCGHYTQMVWRETKEVGCGMATCSDSHEQVWVCRYQPAGNFSGERPY